MDDEVEAQKEAALPQWVGRGEDVSVVLPGLLPSWNSWIASGSQIRHLKGEQAA